MTICCSWTQRRWSALVAARPSSARRSLTPRTAGTAQATPGSSGVSGCTRSSPQTTHRGRSRSPPPNAMSARSRWSCSSVAVATAGRP